MKLPFVGTIREYESIDSTSDEARKLVEENDIELPLLVVARCQTAGRGRGTNRWWSDEGSLTFSLAFDPESLGISREQEPRIALTSVVAIIHACESIAPLGIRWPNDIEYQGKKLGGVLPENFFTAYGRRFILGVGLNVATNMGHAPDDVRKMATSLAELTQHPLDKSVVQEAVLFRMAESLGQLAIAEANLPRSWIQRDMLLGVRVKLKLGDEIIEGIGAGIAEDGALILRTEYGDKRYYAGQVLRPLVQ